MVRNAPVYGETILSEIELVAFRNLERLQLRLPAGITLLTGANGQGKTNILEAMATIGLTKSPRASSLREVMKWDSDFTRIRGVLDANERGNDVFTVEIDARGGVPKKRLLLNGENVPASELIGRVPTVLFTPDHLSLVSGGPDERRRLLDIILTQISREGRNALLRYSRALLQRNHLLRAMRDGTSDGRELLVFTEEVVSTALDVLTLRKHVTEKLSETFQEHLAAFTPDAEGTDLQYAPCGREHGIDISRETLLSELHSRLSRDIATGSTSFGPHRDDLLFSIRCHPARGVASQGQRRSIVLALLLSSVDLLRTSTGTAPLLLLDDVLSELDADRQERFLARLRAPVTSQVIITATDASEDLVELAQPNQHWTVAAGTVFKQDD